MSEKTKTLIDGLTMRQADRLIALLEARTDNNEVTLILQNTCDEDLRAIFEVFRSLDADRKGGEVA